MVGTLPWALASNSADTQTIHSDWGPVVSIHFKHRVCSPFLVSVHTVIISRHLVSRSWIRTIFYQRNGPNEIPSDVCQLSKGLGWGVEKKRHSNSFPLRGFLNCFIYILVTGIKWTSVSYTTVLFIYISSLLRVECYVNQNLKFY